MNLLSESDLAKCEPEFLWRSPLSYEIETNGLGKRLVFGRLSKPARASIIGLFFTLVVAGIMELTFGWPLYAAILPIIITSIGAWASSNRRKKFKGCQLEITPDGVSIISPTDRLKLSRLVEVRVENRWKRRDGSFIVNGDSELFLAIQDTLGCKLFFPLAKSGVLRDLDTLAADIASSGGCPVSKKVVM